MRGLSPPVAVLEVGEPGGALVQPAGPVALQPEPPMLVGDLMTSEVNASRSGPGIEPIVPSPAEAPAGVVAGELEPSCGSAGS